MWRAHLKPDVSKIGDAVKTLHFNSIDRSARRTILATGEPPKLRMGEVGMELSRMTACMGSRMDGSLRTFPR